MLDIIKTIAGSLRMKQWVKNAFIFFPLLFSGHFLETARLGNVVLTFVGFSFVASGLYIFNDLLDSKHDQYHPQKCLRPLASGKISRFWALVMMFTILAAGLTMIASQGAEMLSVIFIYMALHLFYNLLTKKVVIIDVINIALGFQIRIWAGAISGGVVPSAWLQMCIFLLALFLGFTKRRYELVALGDNAGNHRRVLKHYTPYVLDQIIIICSTLAIAFYGLYTMSDQIMERTQNHLMLYSVTFVIYGMFRYLYLIHVKKLGDDPAEVIFADKALLIDVCLWIAYISAVLYF